MHTRVLAQTCVFVTSASRDRYVCMIFQNGLRVIMCNNEQIINYFSAIVHITAYCMMYTTYVQKSKMLQKFVALSYFDRVISDALQIVAEKYVSHNDLHF